MTRVFLDDAQISGDTARVTGSDAHHLLNVLRVGLGDTFTIVDERGAEREATVTEAREHSLSARRGEARRTPAEPRLKLTLYHGLPRASRYETALRMCTELGVSGFVPVLSAKSVVRLSGGALNRKQERWQRIVEEAAKQCGRTQIPEVVLPMAWGDALRHFRASKAPGVMPSAGLAGSDAPSLGESAAGLPDDTDALALFIGPESGFDLAEESTARDAGVTLVTMGPRILRTETAAVVAAAICLDRAEELS
ncbi:MAG: RsmE family RNA methyltransferase, partial [Armatimonadota bacterium]